MYATKVVPRDIKVHGSSQVGEAFAEALGVTRQTIWRWIKKGRVKGQRLGATVWIEKKAVEALK